MAIFHLSVKSISRRDGRSAVAAAAYRAAERITDDREGVTHDYTRKQGILWSEIIAPEDAPEWAFDRTKLWNAAEAAERRKDAKVAREWEIALPAELPRGDQVVLALQMARYLSDRYRIAVDVAVHAPSADGDERNVHAHLLGTTREIGPDGFGAKTRILDQAHTSSEEVEHIRAWFAERVNRALTYHHTEARVDHRSYERQGIDLEPTVHLGPKVTAVEKSEALRARREGRRYQPVTDRGQLNWIANQLNHVTRQIVAEREMVSMLDAARQQLAWEQARYVDAERQREEQERRARQLQAPNRSMGPEFGE